ncbi:MAG: hypothetical protein D4R44_07640 [Actinobacteria bacterium]|nr:MAG: hypothetical protein D4R44_07640 [Actinomycetota bacterium]
MPSARYRVRQGTPRVVFSLLATVALFGTFAIGFAYRFTQGLAQSVAHQETKDELIPVYAPLLSARRAPAVLSANVRLGGFTTALDSIGRNLPAQSCLIVSAEGQHSVAIKPNLPVIPASNMKLLTATVALEVLGPDFTYTTSLVGLIEANRVVGDLWIVGGGDPLLSTPTYPTTESYPTIHPTNVNALIDSLVASGITEITGAVVGDESRYDKERFTPSLGLGVRTTEVGPLGALLLNDGVVLTSPIKPDNPALSAAQEFVRLLGEHGIAVLDGASIGTASSDLPVIASVQSQPLTEVIAEMLSNSDNNTADLMLKEIGLARLGSGTRSAGAQVIVSVLKDLGQPTEGLVVIDGSGLDRGNRITCSLLISLLERDGGFGPIGKGLAVAGKTGTLRDLLGDTTAGDRLRAKTGTLTGAKALSGFVSYTDNKATMFTLILNGAGVSNQGAYRPIWNSLASTLGKFSSEPSVEIIRPHAP